MRVKLKSEFPARMISSTLTKSIVKVSVVDLMNNDASDAACF